MGEADFAENLPYLHVDMAESLLVSHCSVFGNGFQDLPQAVDEASKNSCTHNTQLKPLANLLSVHTMRSPIVEISMSTQ